MKGLNYKFLAYMDGADKRFIIPVYQRNYDWRKENCIQLFDDLVKVIKEKRPSHFFGSIVSVHKDGEFSEHIVIDGQQRLTTVSLLLLAMYKLMKKGTVVPEKNNLADKIYKTYLINEWQEDLTLRIKLKQVKDDSKAFIQLFGDDENQIPESSLTLNYKYFYNRIAQKEVTVDDLYSAINKLEIINITLGSDDNPQLIFESMNSTGLALNESDKIRNFVLMGLPVKQQEMFYEKYWKSIEARTDYKVDDFVRDYLTIKQSKIPNQKMIYAIFKAYVANHHFDIEDLLKDLLNYAKRYEILLTGRTPNQSLNASIIRLLRLKTTVIRPYLLEVLRIREEGEITYDEVREIFEITESYIFRRAICNIPSNGLNKIYQALHNEILHFDDTLDNYLEKFKYVMTSKDYRKFPNDRKFMKNLDERKVYLIDKNRIVYMFERFNNYDCEEENDVYGHCDEGRYSIEHIMPRTLTPGWKTALGENYEMIHDTWLNRLANLTLTAYNSEYSNRSFVEKRDMENGFHESGLRINSWIAKQSKWTEEELKKRSEDLLKKALEIWPKPVTDYKPPENQLDSYTLDDDMDFTGQLIARYTYDDMIQQPVKNWKDMFVRVVTALHEKDESVLVKLVYAENEDISLSKSLSSNKKSLRSPIKIDDGIFLEGNTSTSRKIDLLRKLFKVYNEDPEDLVMYLRPEDDELVQED